MNSRGAVELALLFIAFNLRILDTDIYSSLVIIALVTTLLFPFVVRSMIRKEPRIMN